MVQNGIVTLARLCLASRISNNITSKVTPRQADDECSDKAKVNYMGCIPEYTQYTKCKSIRQM